MSKRHKTVVPDFSSKRSPSAQTPPGKGMPAPAAAPKAPAIKPQATSSKAGHRGQ